MRLQLSTRLLLTIVFIQLGMATVLVWNNSRIIQQNHVAQLEQYYLSEEAQLEHTIAIGLLYQDRAMLAESIDHLRSRSDVDYVVVFDRKQRTMASLGKYPAESYHVDENIPLIDALSSGIYRLSTDITKGDQLLGHMVLGYSTAPISRFISQAKRQNILIALVTLFLFLSITFILWRYITSGLRSLEKGVKQFSGGNMDYRVSPVHDGVIDGVASALNELTTKLQTTICSLQSSEDRFRQLAENINEVFWLGSPDWREVYYVSPAYEKKWEQCAEELYQNPQLWIEAVHPYDKAQVLEDIPKDVGSIKGVVDFREYRIQVSGDKVLWIKARAYPIYDGDGKVIRVAGIAEDITARKQIEEELRQNQKMDALGKLTGGVSHDYNNILAIISGYAELLDMQLGENEKFHDYLQHIRNATVRGTQLTKKLLTFSKRNIFHPENVDINRVVLEQKDMLEKTLTPRVNLDFKLADELGSVWVDRNELETAIVNICINAMHAMDGVGQLIVTSRNICIGEMDANTLSSQLNTGEYVMLSFKDNGAGMDELTKERIFEPFFSTKGSQGTGLGLSQVYGFVMQSKGLIRVESEPGKGTEVLLFFPRLMSDHRMKATPSGVDAGRDEDYRGNETILVVDDEVALLELARETLSEQGYQVICANSGKEALTILKNQPIDLLLTDVVMPEMDGYTLARSALKDNPHLKVQVVSGHDDIQTNSDIDEQLKDNLIRKPYLTKTLLKKIRSVLDNG